MRTRIKVTDLTIRQWDALQGLLMVEYDFDPLDVRACVEFESDAAHPVAVEERHVEMPVMKFASLMTELHSMQVRDTAEAALTPDALPDRRPALNFITQSSKRPIHPEFDELLSSVREFPSYEEYPEP